MILNDKQLIRRLHYDTDSTPPEEQLTIHPTPNDIQIQPASIDLRLGFYTIREPGADPTQIEDELVIEPGDFLLAETYERVNVPVDLVGFLTGRSTVGRKGVIVHATAGLLDPGYGGRPTLEVANLGPETVTLEPEQRVCQVYFIRLTGNATPYDGQYDGDSSVSPAGEL